MTRRLPLLFGALTAALAFASSLPSAEAGHVHFSGGVHFGGGAHFGGGGGGGFHWGGGVHVGGGATWGSSYHWARPAWTPNRWGYGGHIYVRPYYGYYPYYPTYTYYNYYTPSYYGESYYPVAPAYGGPGVIAAAPYHPPLPRLGVGVFAGGVQTDYNQQNDIKEHDIGLLARFRLTDGLIVEGELGKTSTDVGSNSDVRVDRRLGGSLLYEFGAYNKLAPYVLAGLGVQQADVGGSYSTTQDFGELGIGLRYAISPHFHLTLDVRAGSRQTVSSDQTMPTAGTARSVAPPPQNGPSEDYTRARLAAVLYF